MKKSYRSFTGFGAVGIALVAAFGAVVACGGDDDDDVVTDGGPTSSSSSSSGDAAQVAAENVVVTVNYNGALRGPIITNLFSSFPPAGPPSALGSNENPTLPGSNTVKFSNVKPGTYHIFSYLMVGPEHRMGPNTDTDPGNNPAISTVTVVDGTVATATITLEDPLPADGGTDGGDDTDAGDGADSGTDAGDDT